MTAITQRDYSNLPANVLVIHVTNKQGLGGEGIRLDIHVRTRHLVDEAALADVRIASDK